MDEREKVGKVGVRFSCDDSGHHNVHRWIFYYQRTKTALYGANEMSEYQCPVCDYAHLSHPPKDFNICPSCGTEFDNDDYDKTHAELRAEWIENGRKWWSRYEQPPKDSEE